eukprot:Gb_31971 [translate_table: standard]
MYAGSAVPVAVQVESLNALASLCLALSSSESSEKNGMQGINSVHLQLALPCILVALCSAIQAVRRAATECIRALHALWHCMAISAQKNGKLMAYQIIEAYCKHFSFMSWLIVIFVGLLIYNFFSLGSEPVCERYIPMDVFGEFMEQILQLKKLFDSDGNFLASFLSSTLNSSGGHISAPNDLNKRLLYYFLD